MIKKYINNIINTVRQVVREPRSIGALLRAGLVNLWRARGGVYGLGYVVTFVYLEARMLFSDLVEAETVADAVFAQLGEWLLRLGLDSLLNMLFAFMWPVWLLQHFGGWGIWAIVAAFVLGEKVLRPLVERHVPELRPAAPAPADLPE
jgi:hypothetical protein